MAGRSRLKGGPFKYSKLDLRQMRSVVRSFARDDTAVEASRRVGIDIRSINRLYQLLRERLCACDYDDLSLTNDEIDRELRSDDYAAYELARKRRARGWPKKYVLLYRLETEHRYLRHLHAPNSTIKVLARSLKLDPLGSQRVDEPWTYNRLDAAHRKWLVKPRLTLQEFLERPIASRDRG